MLAGREVDSAGRRVRQIEWQGGGVKRLTIEQEGGVQGNDGWSRQCSLERDRWRRVSDMPGRSQMMMRGDWPVDWQGGEGVFNEAVRRKGEVTCGQCNATILWVSGCLAEDWEEGTQRHSRLAKGAMGRKGGELGHWRGCWQ
jgi:hypothetical protein